MNQIRNQVRALTTKRQQLKDEIESETQRLLAGRRDSLAKLQGEAEHRLESLSEQLEPIQGRLDTLDGIISEKKATLNDLDRVVGDKSKEIIVLDSRVSGLKLSVATLKVASIDTQKEIEAEKELLSRVINERETTESAVSQLESARNDLTIKIEQLTRDFDTKKAEFEQELNVLLLKQEKAAEKTEKMQQESELIYKDIAVRLKTCDEKEKNLRIRERKVADSESSIRNNAELLNL